MLFGLAVIKWDRTGFGFKALKPEKCQLQIGLAVNLNLTEKERMDPNVFFWPKKDMVIVGMMHHVFSADLIYASDHTKLNSKNLKMEYN